MTRKPFNKTILSAIIATILVPISPVLATSTASATLPVNQITVNNTVQSWTSSVESDGSTTLAIRFEQRFNGQMASFVGPNGDYLAFDFPNYNVKDSARASGVAQGLVKGVRFVETGRRLRAIIHVEQGSKHRAFVQDGILIVRVATDNVPEAKPVVIPNAPEVTTVTNATTPELNVTAGPVVVQPAVGLTPTAIEQRASIRDIEFKKTGNNSGQMVIDLSQPGVKVKVYREGVNLAIELPDTTLPRNLARRLRVENMETPVTAITPSVPREGFTKLTMEMRGGWDYTFAQNNNIITVDVVKIGDEPLVGGRKVFTGRKLSLSFQQIDVRTVLQILAEFTGLNIVASDNVQGNITLRLNEVPWDQALDIILSSRDLDMRRTGQVIIIAPRAELIARERQEMEQRQANQELEPMLTENFQLNYQRAEDVEKILTPSERGTIRIDPRTNQMFLRDTSERIEEARRMIRQIDVPVRQVTIEAKIVEVTDSFAKNVGVKFGVDGARMNIGGGGLALGSTIPNNLAAIGGNQINGALNVNLPGQGVGGNQPGSFAFTLFNRSLTRFLNLEVNALEADGKARTISRPRIVTSDGKEAVIEQGTQLPYLQASSSGAANVAFKNATMSLRVTPQITPDGRVTLDLSVNKDSVGQTTTAGPAIDTKQVRTRVLVEDGGTIVIGGIFSIDEVTNQNKVPLLGDLPIVGHAFRNNSRNTTKREMVIMITPRVIESLQR